MTRYDVYELWGRDRTVWLSCYQLGEALRHARQRAGRTGCRNIVVVLT